MKNCNHAPSLFANVHDKTPKQGTWEEIFRMITADETLCRHTAHYRYLRANGLKGATAEKQACPLFSVAVEFSGGKSEKHVVGYTGCVICDFDHLPGDEPVRCRALAAADPHVLLTYVTLSGEGLRLVVRASDVSDYPLAFRQVNEHYAGLLGHPYDPACKNHTRLSFAAYDPDAFFRPDADPLPVVVPQPVQPVGAGEEARPRRGRPRKSVAAPQEAFGAALALLEKQGVVYAEGNRNNFASRLLFQLNRYGVERGEAEALVAARCAGLPEEEVRSAAASAYSHTEEFATVALPARSRTVWHRATPQEIIAFLDTQARFRHNVMSDETEISWISGDGTAPYVSLSDRDVSTLWARMGSATVRVSEQEIRSVIQSDYTPLFHPVREYLESLKVWDGHTDHIARLAATVHVRGDHARFTESLRKWLVAMIACLFDPDAVNHQILVFIGRQGNYKSTWFHYLLPPELRRYFYTKVNSDRMTKDDHFTLTQFALVCFEEIDYMRPSDLNQLKAMITVRDINERRAYGHHKEHRKHIASFCGTGNNIQFLNDPSGNRRWLPFEVEEIDSPLEHPFDYAGIYAQAYALCKSGFRYWFDQEEIREVNRQNARFEVPVLEEELVSTYFRRPVGEETGVFLTTAQILERISGGIRQVLSPVRVGMAMTKLGFERRRIGNQRGFLVIILDAEAIQRNMKSGAVGLSISQDEEQLE